MPGNILNADTGFPTFAEGEDSNAKIDKVMNYLYMLLEQLRYSLANLDADNFNDTGLREIGEGIARPLQTSFENEFSKTNALIEGWSNEYGSQIKLLTEWVGTDEDGNLLSSAATITSAVSKNTAEISNLAKVVDADSKALAGFKTEVSNTYATTQQFSSFQNSMNSTYAGFVSEANATYAKTAQIASVTDENGNVTAASIAAEIKDDTSLIKLIADKVNISGFVTFESLANDGDGSAYINGNNLGLVSDSEGNSTASLRFWLNDDIKADERYYLIGELYTSGNNDDLEDCTLHIKTSTSRMKITAGDDLDISSSMAVSIESGTSYVEIIANGSALINSDSDTVVTCEYMTILPSVSKTNSKVVGHSWQFFDDGIYFNGYRMVATPS